MELALEMQEMAEAIANAVVEESTQSAQVQVTGGSPAETYKVI
ncbi:hypothetical protein [Vibrio diabolicus]